MTDTFADDHELDTAARKRLTRRLLPLTVAVALLGFLLWVPVEKLFMTEIGFDPASIGLMAAAYAALTPIIEIPSGVLADRWSRRGVLIVAAVAMAFSSLVGGLSHNVSTYIGAALVLAVYFAMYSGTMDAIVYDTVLEEIGASEQFERRIGRVRAIESASLVAGALAGGVLAELTSPRLTYFLTVPFALAAALALLRFREPTLHKTQEAASLRTHIGTTYRAILQSSRLVPIIVLALLAALLLTSIFEFGPLWLLAGDAASGFYVPYWASLMATLGVGGLLAGRIPLHRRGVLVAVSLVVVAAGVGLTVDNLTVAIVAQVTLVLFALIASIRATQFLHDSVPSAIRTGVASGVGALGWMVFVPFASVLGLVSRDQGVHLAAWLLVGVTVAICLALVVVARSQPTGVLPAEELTNRLLRDVRRCLIERRQDIEPLDCNETVELVSDFLDGELGQHTELKFVNHVRGCLGCSRYVEQVQRTVEELRNLPDDQQLPDATRDQLVAAFSRSIRT